MSKWINVEDRLPELGDYSVLAWFNNGKDLTDGGIDMVHVEDYFKDITNGRDEQGNQLYTKWYLTQKIMFWMPLPNSPFTKI